MIGFIGTSVTSSLNHTYCSAIADLHNLQFTVAHAPGFSVSAGRLLATDLNTETRTSNHYEVFLPFLVQSPWNLGNQQKLSLAKVKVTLRLTVSQSVSLGVEPQSGAHDQIFIAACSKNGLFKKLARNVKHRCEVEFDYVRSNFAPLVLER
jgi:hypothetical protein